MKLHRLVFLIFLLFLPIQTRILFQPNSAYIDWYFNYHLAFFAYLSDILLITCFTAWLIFDPPKESVKKTLIPIFAFLGVLLLGLFHVEHKDLGVYTVIKWVEIFTILLYLKLTLWETKDFHIAAIFLYISSVAQALLAWIQFHVQRMVGLKWFGEYIPPLGTPGLATIETATGKIIRAYGTMPHPNVLGAFLVLGLVLGLYLLSKNREQRIWNKIAISAGTFVILIGIFATFSRMAWLSAAIAIVAFTVHKYLKQNKSAMLVTIAIVIVSCGTILAFYQSELTSRVIVKNEASIVDRSTFNRFGWELAKQAPIIGVGVGNYVPALQNLHSLEPWQYQPPHNMFLFILAETGFLGLAAFLAILWLIFSGIKKVTWDYLSFGLIVMGGLFLLMSQVDHYFATIQQGRLMFAVVLGMLAALPNLNNTATITSSAKHDEAVLTK